MKITLSPVRMDLPTPLAASVAGDVLTIDGQRIDFAALAEGDLYPGDELGSPWITSPVERIGGEIRLTLVSPHGGNPDGSRIVKTVMLLLPRGNRKTSLAAALALLHLFGPENRAAGQVLFAACDREQASIGSRSETGRAANPLCADRPPACRRIRADPDQPGKDGRWR